MAKNKVTKKKNVERPKTRWGCIITVLVVALVLGGGGYLFYSQVYPVIKNQKTETNYVPETISKEGKDKLQGLQDFGESIKDSEQTGRADPFAPI